MRAVRLTGAVYFDIAARAPWVAQTPAIGSICTKVMPEFEHVISFHIVLSGGCWAELIDKSEPPIRLESGDVVMFVAGDSHVMSSDKGSRAQPNMDMYYRPKDQPLPFVFNEFGGSGELTRVVCGYLGCDARPFNPILNALPRM